MKKLFFLIAAAVLFSALFAGSAVASESGGIQGDTYYIYDAADLVAFADYVNNDVTHVATDAMLMADVDLVGVEWVPIGSSSSVAYAGVFDGGGHTIDNFGADLVYTRSDETGNSYGFFKYVSSATIRNVRFTNIDISVKSTLSYPGTYCMIAAIVCDTSASSSHSVTIDSCIFQGKMEDIGTQSSASAGTASLFGVALAHSIIMTNCIIDIDMSSRVLYLRCSSAGRPLGAGGAITVSNTYIMGDISMPSGDRGYGGCGYLYGDLSGSYSGIVNLASVSGGAASFSTVLINSGSYRVTIQMSKCYQNNRDQYRSGYSNYGDSYGLHTVNVGAAYQGLTGADVSASEYNTKSWWENIGYDFDTWYWDEEKQLPIQKIFVFETVSIGSPEALQTFAARVNSGETNLHGVLSANIDMSGVINWVPIGSSSAVAYSGEFNGNGYIISGLKSDIGLFFCVGEAEIKNLKLADISVTCSNRYLYSGGIYCGALVGIHVLGHLDINNIETNNCIVTMPQISGSISSSVIGIIAGRSFYGDIRVSNVLIDGCILEYTTSTGIYRYKGLVLGTLFSNDVARGFNPVISNCVIYDSSVVTDTYGNAALIEGVVAARPMDNELSIYNNVVISSGIISNGMTFVHRIQGYNNVNRGLNLNYNYVSDDTTTDYAVTSSLTGVDGLTKPLTDMQQQAFYTTAGNWDSSYQWDFENTWYMDPVDNIPKLQSFRPPQITEVFRVSSPGIPPTRAAEARVTATNYYQYPASAFSYQWYSSLDNGASWQIIDGQTSNHLLQTLNSGSHLLKCLVTDFHGTTDTYAAGYTDIRVTVVETPTITVQPIATPDHGAHSSQFTVRLSGKLGGFGDPNIKAFAYLKDQTTTDKPLITWGSPTVTYGTDDTFEMSLLYEAQDTIDATHTFKLEVWNYWGDNPGAASTRKLLTTETLSVSYYTGVSPAITDNPTISPAIGPLDQIVSVSISGVTGTAPITYHWQEKIGSTWHSIPSAASAASEISVSDNDETTHTYRVLVSNRFGSASSVSVTYHSYFPPQILHVSVPSEIYINNPFTFSADVVHASRVVYQLSSDNGRTWTDISSPHTVTTSGTYSFRVIAYGMIGEAKSSDYSILAHKLMPRPMQSMIITPIPTTAITNITDAFDVDPGQYPDFKQALKAVVDPIEGELPDGFLFVIVFGVVFLMLWLITKNTAVPAIIGLIFGGTILALFPASYYGPAIVILALSIAGGIYRIFQPPK